MGFFTYIITNITYNCEKKEEKPKIQKHAFGKNILEIFEAFRILFWIQTLNFRVKYLTKKLIFQDLQYF